MFENGRSDFLVLCFTPRFLKVEHYVWRVNNKGYYLFSIVPHNAMNSLHVLPHLILNNLKS